MNPAKITLSEEELELVQNARVLLTKNTIIEKVYALFGEIAHHIRDQVWQHQWALPPEVAATDPKISRGENYKGLPYVMLDYPRLFGKENVFAIRLLFWWGNFFSVTLHLKGQYKQLYVSNIKKQWERATKAGIYISIGNDEWRHDFEADNYIPLHQVGAGAVEEVLSAHEFCKLSARIPLHQWDEAPVLLPEMYGVLLAIAGC
jgi:hypothetical protein